MSFDKKDKVKSKENIGAMKLSDDVLDKASGGSVGFNGHNKSDLMKTQEYLLNLGDDMYLFDNKEDADAFRNGYYAKKGENAATPKSWFGK